MRVKNTINIGKPDAVRLGLDKTLAGETNDVKKEVADEMLAKGWAVDPRSEELDSTARPHSSAETEVKSEPVKDAPKADLKDQPRGK